jgi:hypothetical protein
VNECLNYKFHPLIWKVFQKKQREMLSPDQYRLARLPAFNDLVRKLILEQLAIEILQHTNLRIIMGLPKLYQQQPR